MTKSSDNTGESTNANKIIIRGEGRRLQLFDSPMLGDLSVQGEQLSTLYKFGSSLSSQSLQSPPSTRS